MRVKTSEKLATIKKRDDIYKWVRTYKTSKRYEQERCGSLKLCAPK